MSLISADLTTRDKITTLIELIRQADLNRKVEQIQDAFVLSGHADNRIHACAMGAAWALDNHIRPRQITDLSGEAAEVWTGNVFGNTLVAPCDLESPDFPDETCDELADNIVIHLNDNHRYGFAEIADYLEEKILPTLEPA